MNIFWAVLFTITAVLNVIDGISIGVTGEGNPIFMQVTDQFIIALLFTGFAVREYGKGRN